MTNGLKIGHYLVEVEGETMRGVLFADNEVADYWISPLILAPPFIPDLTSHNQVLQSRQISDLPELIADFRSTSLVRCPKSVKKIPLFVVHTDFFEDMLVTFRKGQTHIYRISNCYRDGLNELQTADSDEFPFCHCFSVIDQQKYINTNQNRRQRGNNWIKNLIPEKPFELFLNDQYRNYSLKDSLARRIYESLSSGNGLKPLYFCIENVSPTQFYAIVQCAQDAEQNVSIANSRGRSTRILLNETFRTDLFQTGCSICIEFNNLEVLMPILGSSYYYFPLGTRQHEHTTKDFRYATIPISGGNLTFEFNIASRDLKVKAKVSNVSFAELQCNENALREQATQYSSLLLNQFVRDVSTDRYMAIVTIEVNHNQFIEFEKKRNGRNEKHKCSIVVAWGVDQMSTIFNDDDSDLIMPSLQNCPEKRKEYCIPYDPASIVMNENGEFIVNGNISDRFRIKKCKNISGDNNNKSRKRQNKDEESDEDEVTCCIIKKNRALKDPFTEAHRLAVFNYFGNLSSSEVNCDMKLETMSKFEHLPDLFEDCRVAKYISQQCWKAALKSTTVIDFSNWVRYSITNWRSYSNLDIISAVETTMKIPLQTNSSVGDGKKLTREALADFLIPQIMDHIFKDVGK